MPSVGRSGTAEAPPKVCPRFSILWWVIAAGLLSQAFISLPRQDSALSGSAWFKIHDSNSSSLSLDPFVTASNLSSPKSLRPSNDLLLKNSNNNIIDLFPDPFAAVNRSTHQEFNRTLRRLLQLIETGNGFVKNESLPSCFNFAYFKTHKTASGTLEQLFSSFGIRHGLRFAGPPGGHFWPRQNIPCGKNFDDKQQQPCANLTVKHVLSRYEWWSNETRDEECQFANGTWFNYVVASYSHAMCGTVPIITSVREPLSHLESAMRHFRVSMTQGYLDPDLWNPLIHDFRLFTAANVEYFSNHFLQDGGGSSSKVFAIVLEELSKSLVVLRRKLNWNLSDVIFALGEMGKTKRSKAYKGKAKRGGRTFLLPENRSEANKFVEIDQTFYDYCAVQLERHWEEVAKAADGGTAELEREVLTLSVILNTTLPAACGMISEYCESKMTPISECAFNSDDWSLLPWYAALCSFSHLNEHTMERLLETGPPFYIKISEGL